MTNADEVVKHILFNGHLYERCCEGSHSVRGKVVEVVALSGVLVPPEEHDLSRLAQDYVSMSEFEKKYKRMEMALIQARNVGAIWGAKEWNDWMFKTVKPLLEEVANPKPLEEKERV